MWVSINKEELIGALAILKMFKCLGQGGACPRLQRQAREEIAQALSEFLKSPLTISEDPGV